MTAWLAVVGSRPLTLGLIGRHPRTPASLPYIVTNRPQQQRVHSTGTDMMRKKTPESVVGRHANTDDA